VPTAMPTSSPAPTDAPDCPYDIVLIANVGETLPPELPISIIEQNSRSVVFEVRQVFNQTILTTFTQYHENPTGDTECFEDDNVLTEEVTNYTAYCMHNVPLTVVDLWYTDPTVLTAGLDDAVVPPCCHPPSNMTHPTVQYTYKIYCETKCPDDASAAGNRRLSEEVVEAETVAAEALEVSTSDHEQKYTCSSRDYPCNGDMVYVCHYSKRHGYQTFCVPEHDSDIVSFYPRDYCGLCVGGNGEHMEN